MCSLSLRAKTVHPIFCRRLARGLLDSKVVVPKFRDGKVRNVFW
jgi:hypothetical protein